MDPGGKQQGRVGVPQIMKADRSQIELAHQILELVRDDRRA